jgi:hypothetical protein
LKQLLEYGAYVALALLVIWVILLIPLTRGKLKVLQFGAASAFLALMVPFFWLGPEITELTILKVGSFKTNAEQATKYFQQIKDIRGKIETEAQVVNSALSALKTDIAEARTETQKIKERMADRQLSDQQISQIADRVKPFAGQQFQVVTYWDIKECVAIANRIYEGLTLGGWQFIKPEGGRWLMAGIAGVQIYVNPKTDDKTKGAAKALSDALNAAKIDAELRDENSPEANNMINLNVVS